MYCSGNYSIVCLFSIGRVQTWVCFVIVVDRLDLDAWINDPPSDSSEEDVKTQEIFVDKSRYEIKHFSYVHIGILFVTVLNSAGT